MISSVPLLTDQVIAGRHRIACRRHGAEDGSPIISGAGHFAMEDEPGLVTDTLPSFLHRQANGEKS